MVDISWKKIFCDRFWERAIVIKKASDLICNHRWNGDGDPYPYLMCCWFEIQTWEEVTCKYV